MPITGMNTGTLFVDGKEFAKIESIDALPVLLEEEAAAVRAIRNLQRDLQTGFTMTAYITAKLPRWLKCKTRKRYIRLMMGLLKCQKREAQAWAKYYHDQGYSYQQAWNATLTQASKR